MNSVYLSDFVKLRAVQTEQRRRSSEQRPSGPLLPGPPPQLRGAAAGLREPPPYFLRLLPPRLGEGPARPQPCASCRSEELKNISDKSLLLIKLFQEFCEGTK
ncbi:C-_U-Editing Enzyme Apobec-4-Like [Manis pentadactyla]|nr:C->U-Editing Enzyme Apobec-4-Like [Manis pentadactyla]